MTGVPAGATSLSVVLPTFARAAALRANLPAVLGLAAVDEVVVVDDGSPAETAAVLAQARHPRLRIVRLATNRGAPAARNAGVAAARGEWVLFAEDDCRFPADFARVLLEEARVHGADAVGAPMVHPGPGESLDAAVTAARRRGRDRSIDAVAGFPAAAIATPLLPAPSLVRRDLALRVRFDEGFGGNAYREETDFFLRAAAAGARCVLTPRTFFWEPRRWPGGQLQRSALAAELWTLRNNWRFVRRHARWLQDEGHIRSPLAGQATFTARRLRRLAAGLAERRQRPRTG